MIIYVAGKFLDDYTNPTREGTLANVNKALDIGTEVVKKGHYALIPHLTYFQEQRMLEMGEPKLTNEWWYKYDNKIIPACQGLLKISPDGYSKGADAEEKLAISLGIPIFRSVDELP